MAVRRQKASDEAPDNALIAEWLAMEAENATRFVQKAMRKAARSAFLWPVEVSELVRLGRSLTELPGIGPFLEKQILLWLKKPPAAAKPSPLRADFSTMPQALAILAKSA